MCALVSNEVCNILCARDCWVTYSYIFAEIIIGWSSGVLGQRLRCVAPCKNGKNAGTVVYVVHLAE